MVNESGLKAELQPYYIVLTTSQTLREGLILLEERGGEEWWFLIVEEYDGDHYAAARFSDFYDLIAEAKEVLDQPLSTFGNVLVSVPTVGLESDVETAYDKAFESEMALALVLDDDDIAGIISTGSRGAIEQFDRTSLLELAASAPEAELSPEEPYAPGAESPSVVDDHIFEMPPQSAQPSRSRSTQSRGRQDPEDNEAKKETSVNIGGDVSDGGEVNVAGRDIIKQYYTLPPEKQTKTQDRRFETAFPHEVYHDKTYELWVGVVLPDAPPLFGDMQEAKIIEEKPKEAVGVEFEVDGTTGKLIPASVEVAVTGVGFDLLGDRKRKLTVYPDGMPDKRRFIVRPSAQGKQRLIVEFTQDGRLLKEVTVEADVFSPQAKPLRLLNLSLKIASFSMTMSFAAGA